MSYQTKQKELILEFLKNNDHRAVTVADIIDYFQKENIVIGQTTVYRYLKILEQKNEIVKYANSRGTSASYQYLKQNCELHFHLKCMICHSLIHLECLELNELEKHIKNHHHFKIDGIKTMIYGKCSKCVERR